MQNMGTVENTNEKRGRGRPRKMVNEVDNKPKGKRGRPRKNPIVQASTNVDPINSALPDINDINNILSGVGKTVNYGTTSTPKVFGSYNYNTGSIANPVNNSGYLPGLNYLADDITMPGTGNDGTLPGFDGMMPGLDDINGILPDISQIDPMGMPTDPVIPPVVPTQPAQPTVPQAPVEPAVPQDGTIPMVYSDTEPTNNQQPQIPVQPPVAPVQQPVQQEPVVPQVPTEPAVPQTPVEPVVSQAPAEPVVPEIPTMDASILPNVDDMLTKPADTAIPGLDDVAGMMNEPLEQPAQDANTQPIPEMPDLSNLDGLALDGIDDETLLSMDLPGLDDLAMPGLNVVPQVSEQPAVTQTPVEPVVSQAPAEPVVPEIPTMDVGVLPNADNTIVPADATIPGLDDVTGMMNNIPEQPVSNEAIPEMPADIPDMADLSQMPGIIDIPEMPEIPEMPQEGMTDAVSIPGLDELDSLGAVDNGDMDDLDGMLPGYGTSSPEQPAVDANLQGNTAQAVYNDYNANTPNIDESAVDYNNYYDAPNYSNNSTNNFQNNYGTQGQAESLKPKVDYSMSSFNGLLTSDKKVVTFIGTTKNGTSFLVNNLAALFSSIGINTAILDMTKNKNSYYIYTKNEEELRKIAYTSIDELKQGRSNGIRVDSNLTVYTALPNDGKDYSDAESILSTIVQNHSVVLIDCDYTTDPSYFALCQEIYLVQSLDILTIQPLTAFLRDLKTQGVLEPEKVRVVINKNMKVGSLTTKILIAGMSFYNDPAMSFMTELFNKDMVKYCEIPFDERAYSKYLESMVNCSVSLSGYSQAFIAKLKTLGEMVYPLTSKQSYGKPAGGFSAGVNLGKKGGF